MSACSSSIASVHWWADSTSADRGGRAILHADMTAAAPAPGADLTQAGEAKVDAFHKYGRVARLRDKPVDVLDGTDHFLRALLAEREGLIKVTVRPPRVYPSL